MWTRRTLRGTSIVDGCTLMATVSALAFIENIREKTKAECREAHRRYWRNGMTAIFKATFLKPSNEDVQLHNVLTFNLVVNTSEISKRKLNLIGADMDKWIGEKTHLQLGMVLIWIKFISVMFSKLPSLRGSSWRPILLKTKSTLNIHNEDLKCFLYDIATSMRLLTPAKVAAFSKRDKDGKVIMHGAHANSPCYYEIFIIKTENIEMPFQHADAGYLEEQNPEILLNIYKFDESKVDTKERLEMLRLWRDEYGSIREGRTEINLQLLPPTEELEGHYVLIQPRKFSAFMNCVHGEVLRRYWCNTCLRAHKTQEAMQGCIYTCGDQMTPGLELPEEPN